MTRNALPGEDWIAAEGTEIGGGGRSNHISVAGRIDSQTVGVDDFVAAAAEIRKGKERPPRGIFREEHVQAAARSAVRRRVREAWRRRIAGDIDIAPRVKGDRLNGIVAGPPDIGGEKELIVVHLEGIDLGEEAVRVSAKRILIGHEQREIQRLRPTRHIDVEGCRRDGNAGDVIVARSSEEREIQQRTSRGIELGDVTVGVSGPRGLVSEGRGQKIGGIRAAHEVDIPEAVDRDIAHRFVAVASEVSRPKQLAAGIELHKEGVLVIGRGIPFRRLISAGRRWKTARRRHAGNVRVSVHCRTRSPVPDRIPCCRDRWKNRSR